ncbi:hypothetical protein ACA910_007872 [Epithemia clementina (nom. ined.)]
MFVQRTASKSTRHGAKLALVRNASSAPPAKYSPKMTESRPSEVGHGGAASDKGIKVACFGASGFLGKYVAGELGSNGFMTYFANRGDDLEMRHLKLAYDLGRCSFVFYEPRDEDSIRKVIADADVVVNLIGKYYESAYPYQTKSFPYIGYKKNYTFQEVNVTIPQKLARICRDMQVDHFVHVSSASASPTAKSEWSRTKFAGEEAIKGIYPWATIIRPTQLFGRDDRLLTDMARMQRFYLAIYLVDKTYWGGQTALTQPVFVGDVAKTIASVCDNPRSFEGRRIDCFGPKDYTYMELAKFVDDCTLRRKPIRPIPAPYYRAAAEILQYQRSPFNTPDLVDVWSEDFLPPLGSPEAYENQDEIVTLKDFGIQAQPIEKVMYEWLQVYREYGHFHYVDGYH